MLIQGDPISWVESFKYLGVTYTDGVRLKVDINVVKLKLYASCNSILGKAYNVDELTKVYLVEASCLPIFTYAIPALDLTQFQINELNVTWNCAISKIFGFNKWDSVKVFIAGLGRLDFKHARLKLCVNFVRENLNSVNNAFRYLLLRYYVTEFQTLCKRYNLIQLEQHKFVISHGTVMHLVHDTFRRSVGFWFMSYTCFLKCIICADFPQIFNSCVYYYLRFGFDRLVVYVECLYCVWSNLYFYVLPVYFMYE